MPANELNQQFTKIATWADARNLIKGGSTQAQLVKTMEELGELAGAVARGNKAGIVDGLGDVVVTLVILARQHNLRLEDCIESAWMEIKDRRGRLIDGIFIKEGD